MGIDARSPCLAMPAVPLWLLSMRGVLQRCVRGQLRHKQQWSCQVRVRGCRQTPYRRYRSVGTRQPGSRGGADNPRRPTRQVRTRALRQTSWSTFCAAQGQAHQPINPSTHRPLSHSRPYSINHATPCHAMPILCQYAFTAPSANIAAFQHCSIEPSQLAMPQRDRSHATLNTLVRPAS